MNFENFDKYLIENSPKVQSFHPFFNDAFSWILKAGGKHFRAKLLLGLVEIYSPELLEKSFPVAAGLEFLHTYSLIHDDLPAMDDSDLRRGVTTLHKKYDEASAILVGDGLNTQAFYMISKADLPAQTRIKLVEILSQNGGVYGMVLGQALDLEFENQKLPLEKLEFLHSKKTGALIAASLKMGAVIANLSQSESEKIYELGLDLGLAFQIEDDILDASSTSKITGKPVNNDEEKNSFTNLLGLEKAKEKRDLLLAKIEKDVKSTPLEKLIKNLINTYLKD